jgi:hypothetical protein
VLLPSRAGVAGSPGPRPSHDAPELPLLLPFPEGSSTERPGSQEVASPGVGTRVPLSALVAGDASLGVEASGSHLDWRDGGSRGDVPEEVVVERGSTEGSGGRSGSSNSSTAGGGGSTSRRRGNREPERRARQVDRDETSRVAFESREASVSYCSNLVSYRLPLLTDLELGGLDGVQGESGRRRGEPEGPTAGAAARVARALARPRGPGFLSESILGISPQRFLAVAHSRFFARAGSPCLNGY